MRNRTAELRGCSRNACFRVARLACAMLVAVACAPPEEPPEKPPAEGRGEMVTGSIEPSETSGAPYPPVEPDPDFIPNVEEEKWEPVPDGPPRGDMQPANPDVEVKEAEIVTDPDKKPEKE